MKLFGPNTRRCVNFPTLREISTWTITINSKLWSCARQVELHTPGPRSIYRQPGARRQSTCSYPIFIMRAIVNFHERNVYRNMYARRRVYKKKKIEGNFIQELNAKLTPGAAVENKKVLYVRRVYALDRVIHDCLVFRVGRVCRNSRYEACEYIVWNAVKVCSYGLGQQSFFAEEFQEFVYNKSSREQCSH
ncbi:hypothetical protein TSAR_008881 [Trichomalopsis sarcophagae]|uniref:Uncharacterized protein n=1 Tax=Trichomalopsis sarcophagae TaxID=543379 RepID=A0A232FG94_9HYME|nr:hypothetical protein TSAR_008881 [Trichomalopsis sarcophagae]